MEGRFFADFLLQGEKRLRLEIAESQVLQLAAQDGHAEAVGDGRVDIQRFAGDAVLLGRFEVFERAHVMQPVGQFDENDANVVHHGQEHLADVFGLARFGGHDVQTADFGDAFDKPGDFRAEALLDAGDGIFRVLDGVMEQRGGKRGGVEAHIGKDVGDFEEMGQIRIAGAAKLVAVALGGDFVGAAHHPGIFRGAVLAELFEQFFKVRIKLALGAVAVEAQRDFVGGRHGLVYA